MPPEVGRAFNATSAALIAPILFLACAFWAIVKVCATYFKYTFPSTSSTTWLLSVSAFMFAVVISETPPLLFLKNNYRYVSDTSPIHVSEKYQKNNIFYDRNGGDETDIMCVYF